MIELLWCVSDICEPDRSGQLPIHAACAKINNVLYMTVIEAVLDKSSFSLQQNYNNGCVALHAACGSGKSPVELYQIFYEQSQSQARNSHNRLLRGGCCQTSDSSSNNKNEGKGFERFSTQTYRRIKNMKPRFNWTMKTRTRIKHHCKTKKKTQQTVDSKHLAFKRTREKHKSVIQMDSDNNNSDTEIPQDLFANNNKNMDSSEMETEQLEIPYTLSFDGTQMIEAAAFYDDR